MTILFILTIIGFAIFLAYQNDRIRQWSADLFNGKNTRLVIAIAALTLIALFYPRINDQINKLKQKLNHR